MHRYHITVLPSEVEEPKEYAIESPHPLTPELVQVAGLLLDEGLFSTEELAEQIPLAQSYCSVEEYKSTEDDGKTFGQRTVERLLQWADKYCPPLLTMRTATDYLIGLVDDVFNKALVNSRVREWEERKARKYGLEPLDWWARGTTGTVYDENHGPEETAEAVLIHASGPQQSEIEVIIMEDIYCCERGSIFRTARHTFTPNAMPKERKLFDD